MAAKTSKPPRKGCGENGPLTPVPLPAVTTTIGSECSREGVHVLTPGRCISARAAGHSPCHPSPGGWTVSSWGLQLEWWVSLCWLPAGAVAELAAGRLRGPWGWWVLVVGSRGGRWFQVFGLCQGAARALRKLSCVPGG